MHPVAARGLAGIGQWPRWLVAAATALAGAAAVLLARESGILEKAELAAYDHIVAVRAPARAGDADVAVVLETEADLQRFRHPLSDEVLADLLERLLAAQPAAILVDKYRDGHLPAGSRLAVLLARNDRVFWLRKVGDGKSPVVRAPPGIEGTPLASCGDVVPDSDGRVRRLLLYLDDASGPCNSLAFSGARRLLERKGVKVGFDQAGSLALGERRLAPLESGDGPYSTADLAGFQLPVEYARATARPITLAEVLDGRSKPGDLRGKLVFFGSSAESLRDFFSVPRAAAREADLMSGVEIHANAARALLDAATSGSPMLRLAHRETVWTSIVLAALATAGIVLLSARWAVGAILAALAAAACYGVARLAIVDGLFVSFVPPLAAVMATAFLAFAVRALREQAERAEVMGLFSRQISSEVAEAIWAQREAFYRDGAIPTQKLVATVLFLDIRGFTTCTEQLGPATVAWLNRGLGSMTDIVIRHRGVVTRFVGDQIMAVYGVPVPRVDEASKVRDARAAVETALDIGSRLTLLNEELEAEGLPPIRVRIGINSGEVTQGAVGSSRRFEYTVLGDVVNTAARLESYATEDDGLSARVLIGETTYRLCGTHFRCEALGALQLKGKVEEVRVYRVHDRQEGSAT